jgi:hypothetical protein
VTHGGAKITLSGGFTADVAGTIVSLMTLALSRYRLLKDDGTDLGLLVGGDLRSRPGDRLYRGATALQVVRIVEADPTERLRGYVVVADADAASASVAVP